VTVFVIKGVDGTPGSNGIDGRHGEPGPLGSPVGPKSKTGLVPCLWCSLLWHCRQNVRDIGFLSLQVKPLAYNEKVIP